MALVCLVSPRDEIDCFLGLERAPQQRGSWVTCLLCRASPGFWRGYLFKVCWAEGMFEVRVGGCRAAEVYMKGDESVDVSPASNQYALHGGQWRFADRRCILVARYVPPLGCGDPRQACIRHAPIHAWIGACGVGLWRRCVRI